MQLVFFIQFSDLNFWYCDLKLKCAYTGARVYTNLQWYKWKHGTILEDQQHFFASSGMFPQHLPSRACIFCELGGPSYLEVGEHSVGILQSLLGFELLSF